MAGEQGYRAQVRPGPGAVARPGSAESFGAGLARTAGDVAEVAHREALEDYAIERRRTQDQEWADFLHGYALHQENLDGVAREARKDGSAGHAERMGEAWDAAREGLLDTITEDSVRQRATAMFEQGAVRFRTGEAAFEEGVRVEKVVTDTQAAWDIGDNRIRRLDKPDDYLAEMANRHAGIEALNIGRAVKDKMLREGDQRGAVAFLRGRIEADPAYAKALIASGAFDGVLDPDQLDQLLNRSDVEIRAVEVQQRREAAEQRAEVREQIQTLEEADRQGIELPEEQYDAAAKLAQHLGDDSLALKIDGLKANRAFARVYGNGNATPAQRGARMAELAGKAKRSADEDRELKWLQDHASALDGAFEKDPAGAIASQSGAPPVDLADPASLRARSAWAARQTRATGRYVPPLTRAETGPLRDLYERQDFKGVFGLLDNFTATDRVAIAGMIAPSDMAFQESAGLGRVFRQFAIDGKAVLRDKPKILDSDDTEIEEGMATVDAEFGQATRFMDPAQREAVRQIARQILAAQVDQGGVKLTPKALRDAYQRALGMKGSGDAETGGMKRWGGTGQWFLVPDGSTAREFAHDVGQFVRQHPDRAAVNPDGSLANLNKLTPVAVGDGWYEFYSPGGAVARRKDGSTFRLRWEPRR